MVCDLKRRGAVAAHGLYDGPLAYEIACKTLKKDKRSVHDTKFYDAALDCHTLRRFNFLRVLPSASP